MRDASSLKAIADNYPEYVLTLDPLVGDRTGGIHHMRTSDFLLADNWLDRQGTCATVGDRQIDPAQLLVVDVGRGDEV